MTKEICCQIDCKKDAEWEIYAESVPDTVACTEHVGELLTDAQEHRIFRIMPECEICNDTGEIPIGVKDDLSGGIEGDVGGTTAVVTAGNLTGD